MINEIGYSNEIKEGFLFFLLCSKRPIYELLRPNLIDQTTVFESQFSGLTDNSFGYDEFERTRDHLINMVNESLTSDDKEFLFEFSKGTPEWKNVDYSKFPAVQWKLLNINKLKNTNLGKFTEQTDILMKILSLP
jgi:hypothetical protein